LNFKRSTYAQSSGIRLKLGESLGRLGDRSLGVKKKKKGQRQYIKVYRRRAALLIYTFIGDNVEKK